MLPLFGTVELELRPLLHVPAGRMTIMTSFDANFSEMKPAADTLLTLLHGSPEGAGKAIARGEERLREGWTLAQVRTTGGRTGRKVKTKATTGFAS